MVKSICALDSCADSSRAESPGMPRFVQQGDLPVHSLGNCHANDWVDLV